METIGRPDNPICPVCNQWLAPEEQDVGWIAGVSWAHRGCLDRDYAQCFTCEEYFPQDEVEVAEHGEEPECLDCQAQTNAEHHYSTRHGLPRAP